MEPKSKFRNDSGGVAGAIQLDHRGEAKGIPVYPGESVWLTEQEQVLTANAPRNEEDNPFANGTFTLEIKAEDVATSRPIGDTQADPAANPEEQRQREEAERELLAAAVEQAPEPESDDIDLREEKSPVQEPETGGPPAPEGDPLVGAVAAHEEAAAAEELVPEEPPAPDPKPAPAPKPLPPKPAG